MTHSLIHASCVALSGKAILILGPSGSGKSALALELMAKGCVLVSDDQTKLHVKDSRLIASAPDSIAGMIEARGMGILAADYAANADIVGVIDLGSLEDQRLPKNRTMTLEGIALPLFHKIVHNHFPAAILQYLKGTRIS